MVIQNLRGITFSNGQASMSIEDTETGGIKIELSTGTQLAFNNGRDLLINADGYPTFNNTFYIRDHIDLVTSGYKNYEKVPNVGGLADFIINRTTF